MWDGRERRRCWPLPVDVGVVGERGKSLVRGIVVDSGNVWLSPAHEAHESCPLVIVNR